MHHAFEHDRQLRLSVQPLEILPRQRRIKHRRRIRRQAGTSQARGKILLRVRRQVRHGQTVRQREIIAHIRLPPSPHRRVHREHQRPATRFLGPPHQIHRRPAVLVNVELEPLRAIRRGGHFFDHGIRQRAHYHDRPRPRRRPRRGALAMRTGQTMKSRRCHHHRKRNPLPEHLDRSVSRRHIAQHAMIKRQLPVSLDVGAQGDAVIRPTRVVIVCLAR